jgi:hypothetical protein
MKREAEGVKVMSKDLKGNALTARKKDIWQEIAS